MFVLRASGSLAISEALWPGTHGFASHGYPWFAFVNGTRRFVGHRWRGWQKAEHHGPPPSPYLHSTLV